MRSSISIRSFERGGKQASGFKKAARTRVNCLGHSFNPRAKILAPDARSPSRHIHL